MNRKQLLHESDKSQISKHKSNPFNGSQVICLDSSDPIAEQQRDNQNQQNLQNAQLQQKSPSQDKRNRKIKQKGNGKDVSSQNYLEINDNEDDDRQIGSKIIKRRSDRLLRKKTINYKSAMRRKKPKTKTLYQRNNKKKALKNAAALFIVIPPNLQRNPVQTVSKFNQAQKPAQALQNILETIKNNQSPNQLQKPDNLFQMQQEKVQLKSSLKLDLLKDDEISSLKKALITTQQIKVKPKQSNMTKFYPSQKFYTQYVEKKPTSTSFPLGVSKNPSQPLDKSSQMIDQNEKPKRKPNQSSNAPVMEIMENQDVDCENLLITQKSYHIDSILQKLVNNPNQNLSNRPQNLPLSSSRFVQQKLEISQNQNRNDDYEEVQQVLQFQNPLCANSSIECQSETLLALRMLLSAQKQPKQSLLKYPVSPMTQKLKQSMKKKTTKQHFFYTLNQKYNIKLLSEECKFEQQYPFIEQDQYEHCRPYNILKDKLRSILSIKKQEKPHRNPHMCMVFYQSQYQPPKIEQPKINKKFKKNKNIMEDDYDHKFNNEPFPQIVQLNKIRLLQPEKLLEFYEIAVKVYGRRNDIYYEKTVLFNLSESTQRRIKHFYA